MNLPDLERLATDWRAATPPDRAPAYIADDLAAGVRALVARVRELEEALTSACRIIEEATQSESQYGDYQDDPDWRLAQHFRSLLAREGGK